MATGRPDRKRNVFELKAADAFHGTLERYHQRQKASQRQRLDEWCRQTMRSHIEPMKKIARSLRQHREMQAFTGLRGSGGKPTMRIARQ